jgi:hypothetical protein
LEEFSAIFITRAASFMTACALRMRNGIGTSRAIGGPMTHHRRISKAATIAASLLLATVASNPHAQPLDGRHMAVDRDVQALKAAYLRCEQAATERLLDIGDAASCSVIYEKLLKVGFGGDFKRLLAWWQTERVTNAPTERIAAP